MEPEIPELIDFLTGDASWQPEVNDIFAKEFELAYAEMLIFDPEGLLPEDPEEVAIASRINPDLEYLNTKDGLGLFIRETGEMIGGYLGLDLVLKKEYRGKGLGTEIVAEYFMRRKDLPTWHMDEPAFSRAGLAAHKSAHRWLLANQDYAIKRLAGEESPSLPVQKKMGV